MRYFSIICLFFVLFYGFEVRSLSILPKKTKTTPLSLFGSPTTTTKKPRQTSTDSLTSSLTNLLGLSSTKPKVNKVDPTNSGSIFSVKNKNVTPSSSSTPSAAEKMNASLLELQALQDKISVKSSLPSASQAGKLGSVPVSLPPAVSVSNLSPSVSALKETIPSVTNVKEDSKNSNVISSNSESSQSDSIPTLNVVGKVVPNLSLLLPGSRSRNGEQQAEGSVELAEKTKVESSGQQEDDSIPTLNLVGKVVPNLSLLLPGSRSRNGEQQAEGSVELAEKTKVESSGQQEEEKLQLINSNVTEPSPISTVPDLSEVDVTTSTVLDDEARKSIPGNLFQEHVDGVVDSVKESLKVTPSNLPEMQINDVGSITSPPCEVKLDNDKSKPEELSIVRDASSLANTLSYSSVVPPVSEVNSVDSSSPNNSSNINSNQSSGSVLSNKITSQLETKPSEPTVVKVNLKFPIKTLSSTNLDSQDVTKIESAQETSFSEQSEKQDEEGILSSQREIELPTSQKQSVIEEPSIHSSINWVNKPPSGADSLNNVFNNTSTSQLDTYSTNTRGDELTIPENISTEAAVPQTFDVVDLESEYIPSEIESEQETKQSNQPETPVFDDKGSIVSPVRESEFIAPGPVNIGTPQLNSEELPEVNSFPYVDNTGGEAELTDPLLTILENKITPLDRIPGAPTVTDVENITPLEIVSQSIDAQPVEEMQNNLEKNSSPEVAEPSALSTYEFEQELDSGDSSVLNNLLDSVAKHEPAVETVNPLVPLEAATQQDLESDGIKIPEDVDKEIVNRGELPEVNSFPYVDNTGADAALIDPLSTILENKITPLDTIPTITDVENIIPKESPLEIVSQSIDAQPVEEMQINLEKNSTPDVAAPSSLSTYEFEPELDSEDSPVLNNFLDIDSVVPSETVNQQDLESDDIKIPEDVDKEIVPDLIPTVPSELPILFSETQNKEHCTSVDDEESENLLSTDPSVQPIETLTDVISTPATLPAIEVPPTEIAALPTTSTFSISPTIDYVISTEPNSGMFSKISVSLRVPEITNLISHLFGVSSSPISNLVNAVPYVPGLGDLMIYIFSILDALLSSISGQIGISLENLVLNIPALRPLLDTLLNLPGISPEVRNNIIASSVDSCKFLSKLNLNGTGGLTELLNLVFYFLVGLSSAIPNLLGGTSLESILSVLPNLTGTFERILPNLHVGSSGFQYQTKVYSLGQFSNSYNYNGVPILDIHDNEINLVNIVVG